MKRSDRIAKLEKMQPTVEDPEVIDMRIRERVEVFRQQHAKNPEQLDLLPSNYRSAMLELFAKCPPPNDRRE